MTLERIRWLRDDFSDEIPPTILHGSGDFKVRRMWWQGVIGDIDLALLLDNGVVPKELIPEARIFLKKYQTEEFRGKARISRADIDEANELLDKILGRTA